MLPILITLLMTAPILALGTWLYLRRRTFSPRTRILLNALRVVAKADNHRVKMLGVLSVHFVVRESRLTTKLSRAGAEVGKGLRVQGQTDRVIGVGCSALVRHQQRPTQQNSRR